MRVLAMSAALVVGFLCQQASAYSIQVQTVPQALQSLWVSLADASQRHAACKSIKQHSPPSPAAYFIAISNSVFDISTITTYTTNTKISTFFI